MSVDLLAQGPTGAQRFARNSGRSLTGDSVGAIRYPSPFFDIAHTYLPGSFKVMLRWCRYYFLTNPLVNAVCYKMAEYPVTDIVFDSDKEPLRKRWTHFFNAVLNFKKFEVEAGLDYNTYGNTFISISFPFQKLLQCKGCKKYNRVEHQKYVFRDYKFTGACKHCNHYGEFTVCDHYIRSLRDIRLVRWNPEYITIQYNEATGESRYFYTIPASMANDIRMGKRHVIERVPQMFIQALRKNKAILFSRDNIYHMKRPTIAQKDRGWGMPMILPVLKDAFYLQVLRKAQEAIAIEHVVPLRVLFPQSASGSADVYCVSHDTLVETRDGVLPASEVQEGSFVKTHTGTWKRVEAHRDRPVGDSKVYELKAAGITAFPLTVSQEHPLLVARKTGRRCGYDNVGEPEWVEAGDVKIGDFVVYPTSSSRWSGTLQLDLGAYLLERTRTKRYVYRKLSPECADIYEFFEKYGGVPDFQHDRGGLSSLLEGNGWDLSDYNNARATYKTGNIDRIPRYLEVDEDLAFAIGVYAAEGHPAEGSPSFALHKEERWVADELERIFKDRGFIKKGNTAWRSVSENGASFTIYDVLLGKFLSEICGSGAQQKRLPRFIQEAPSPVATAALKGLLLGDGHNFCTETRRLGLVTVSPNLAVQTRNMLLSQGFIPCVAKKVPEEEEISKLPSYRLDLNGAQADELARRFGWDRLGWEPGPKKVWSQCGFVRDGYVYLRVRSKKLIDNVETVRGFQVEGEKSFCVVGVATHNSTINLTQWRDKIEQEVLRWRLDNNYIPILPVPVGQQTLGGDGRALMLAQEYRVWSEQIVAGMGVPTEFVYGGMQFSGSNVSMRILENHFLDQKTQRKQLIDDFIIPNVGAYMGWDAIPCHYKRFKMADDLQRSALYLQLNQAGKLSDKSLLEDLDWDSSKESNIIENERNQVLEGQRRQAIAQANIQGEAQLAAMKYQMRGQKMMMEQAPEAAAQGMPAQPPSPMTGIPGQMSPGAAGGMQNAQMGLMNQTGQFPSMEVPPDPAAQQQQLQQQQQQQQAQAPQAGVPQGQVTAPQAQAMQPAQSPLQAGQQGAGYDLQMVAQQVVGWLDQLPEHERNHELINMQQSNPQLYSLVLQLLQARAGAEQNSAAAPLPEQRPPRRGPEAAMV
jgi:hypothetical protein